MPITEKEKELAAVGISVAAGCKPCTDHHVKAVRKAGAAETEIRRAVADALNVRLRAMEIMRDHALADLGAAAPPGNPEDAAATDRIESLVAVGAAYAVNCVSSLERHLATAAAAGVARDEIDAIVKLAAFIKGRAASHVERLVGGQAARPAAAPAERAPTAVCC